ncbi:MAG: putative baseplate assembly protein V [Phage 67_12]|nr:MAG: putative baseplate assembly protein V [Phage 67_12]
MMKGLINAMRLQAQRQASARQETTVGQITSYDPATYSVRVQLQAEGILTGWLPLCSPWIGNGWGMFAAPSVGDMVTVQFFGADIEAGFVQSRLYNDIDRPLSVPSGELWLVHQTGSFAKLTDAGQLLLQDQAGSVVTLNGDGTITVSCSGNASVSVGGNLNATVSGNATANVTGNLSVTAAAASITAPTTITGDVSITGKLTTTGKITGGADIQAATNVSDQGGTKTMSGMRTAFNAHKGHGTPGTGNTPDQTM